MGAPAQTKSISRFRWLWISVIVALVIFALLFIFAREAVTWFCIRVIHYVFDMIRGMVDSFDKGLH